VIYDIGIDKHAIEGRVLTLEFKKFYLVNVYSPNSSTGLKRIDYRVNEWDKDFFQFICDLELTGKPVILSGDLNVCHTEADIVNSQRWTNYPCYTKMERDSLSTFLRKGYIDCFRYFHPNMIKYSSAGKYQSKKKMNHGPYEGMRLDYFIVNKQLIKACVDSDVHDHIHGSDHVPV